MIGKRGRAVSVVSVFGHRYVLGWLFGATHSIARSTEADLASRVLLLRDNVVASNVGGTDNLRDKGFPAAKVCSTHYLSGAGDNEGGNPSSSLVQYPDFVSVDQLEDVFECHLITSVSCCW